MNARCGRVLTDAGLERVCLSRQVWKESMVLDRQWSQWQDRNKSWFDFGMMKWRLKQWEKAEVSRSWRD